MPELPSILPLFTTLKMESAIKALSALMVPSFSRPTLFPLPKTAVVLGADESGSFLILTPDGTIRSWLFPRLLIPLTVASVVGSRRSICSTCSTAREDTGSASNKARQSGQSRPPAAGPAGSGMDNPEQAKLQGLRRLASIIEDQTKDIDDGPFVHYRLFHSLKSTCRPVSLTIIARLRVLPQR